MLVKFDLIVGSTRKREERTGLEKTLHMRRRSVRIYGRGAVDVALDNKRETGLLGLDRTVEHHVPTAGSNIARRHMSTIGKRDSRGRAEARVEVTCAQDASRTVFAEAPCVGANRDLRYGTTEEERTCLTSDRVCEAAEGQVAESMNEDSLLDTDSRAGT